MLPAISLGLNTTDVDLPFANLSIGYNEAPVFDDPAHPPGNVTQADISKAENFGVLAGLGRHLECAPNVKANAALDIMEPLFSRGLPAKVASFIVGHGSSLLDELDDPALKAEYAIRIARILNSKDQKATWVKTAVALLNDLEVQKRCPKKALEMLAMLWADAANHEQTIYWLAAANSGVDKYKEAAVTFFLNGDFANGLTIYDAAPKATEHNLWDASADNFIELITHGLQHTELFRDGDYLQQVLRFHDNENYREIILRLFCHFGFAQYALSLATDIALRCKSVSPMLILSQYIVEAEERKSYINALAQTAKTLDEQQNEPHEYKELSHLIKDKRLTIHEAIFVAQLLPSAPTAVSALLERATSLSLKKNKEAPDLTDLQAVLKAIVEHLEKTKASDCMSDCWCKVLDAYVKHGLFEGAKTVEAPWRKWRKNCGESQDKLLDCSREIYLLCYFAVFKSFAYDIKGIVADIKECDELNKIIQKEHPNRDVLKQSIYDAIKNIRQSGKALTSSHTMVLNALASSPRDCEMIFTYARDKTILADLVGYCKKLAEGITEITDLSAQPIGHRVIESLQFNKLSEKVIEKLKNVQTAAAEASKPLTAYKEKFTEEHFVALATELESLFSQIRLFQNEKWNFKKINTSILPLKQTLETLLRTLEKQYDVIILVLSKLGYK